MFNYLPRNFSVKNFFKSVQIWQNYGHESVAAFLAHPVIYFTYFATLKNKRLFTAHELDWTTVLNTYIQMECSLRTNFSSQTPVQFSSCKQALTVESYTVVMLLTFIPIIISIPPPLTLSFQA